MKMMELLDEKGRAIWVNLDRWGSLTCIGVDPKNGLTFVKFADEGHVYLKTPVAELLAKLAEHP